MLERPTTAEALRMVALIKNQGALDMELHLARIRLRYDNEEQLEDMDYPESYHGDDEPEPAMGSADMDVRRLDVHVHPGLGYVPGQAASSGDAAAGQPVRHPLNLGRLGLTTEERAQTI